MEAILYDKYKQTGVAWFSSIPSHWRAEKIKFSFRGSSGSIKTGPFGSQLKFEDMQGLDIKVYNQKNVIQGDLSLGDEYIDYDKFELLKAFEVFEEDLLITTRGTIGRCKLVPKGSKRGILHPCLMRIQFDSNKINYRYFEYLLEESKLLLVELALKSNSTTLEVIYSETLKNIYAPIPPVLEQTQIAKFLDHKTAQIDRLIAKKKALIEKLNEKRTALITQAVTKGLNPDAPMKDSGVDWLGEVPEHWEVRRLKLIANIFTGKTPKRSDENNYSQEGLLWIKPDDLHENNPVTNTKDRLTSTGANGVPIIPGHSPLVCCIGTVGKFGYAKEKSSTNQQINAIVYNSQIDPIFGLYLASANKSIYYKIANKSVVPIVNAELQGAIVCPLPPKEEQIQIAEFLDNKTNQIDQLVNKASEAIDTLNEYRTALITAAVTGKIDVRNVSVPEQLASL